jgi:hypothetical protein
MQDIPGYEGRYAATKDGRIYNHKLKRYLNGHYTYHNYLRVMIDRKPKAVHRLVASAYIPNPDNLPFINHINGIRDDNNAENLEWCNHTHNMQHAVKMGTHYSIKLQKLTPEMRSKAKVLYSLDFGVAEIANALGVKRDVIRDWVKGLNYKYDPITSPPTEHINFLKKKS